MSAERGVKTSEFWLTLSSGLVGAVLASGAVSNSLALQILGAAATLLSSLGYTAGRVYTKSADTKARGLIAAARLNEAVQSKKSQAL